MAIFRPSAEVLSLAAVEAEVLPDVEAGVLDEVEPQGGEADGHRRGEQDRDQFLHVFHR